MPRLHEKTETLRDAAPAGSGLSLSTPEHDLEVVRNHVREGKFQRSLALITAFSALLSGAEVAYEHYRGSYSRRVMYTPVIMAGLLTGAAISAIFSRRSARALLRPISILTLVDCGVGFYFHIRGIARKPGGWRLPIANIIMGPPIFAPLLFGTAAYLGLVASLLRREESRADGDADRPHEGWLASILPARQERLLLSEAQDIREGRFQQQAAIVTGISSLFSGTEALYSHYKNNFRYKAQWTPVVLAPALSAASFAVAAGSRTALAALPALSLAAGADATVGFFYHARGVLRRPGGRRHLIYNIIYGPPIFAPLLFGAAGMLGLMTTLLRRSRK